MDIQTWLPLLWDGLVDTVYMVGVSTLFTVFLGLPLGVLLVVTDRGGLTPRPTLNRVLGAVVNALRSLPFIILLFLITPFTRLVVGTTIGPTAAIVPLVVSAIPFFARLTETSLLEVDRGLVEAAQAMGSSLWQIVGKVLVPEALPSITLGVAVTIISLVGYSAMAGAVGGGGLGDLAIRYGYQRYETGIMVATVVLLILLVQGVQHAGNILAKNVAHR